MMARMGGSSRKADVFVDGEDDPRGYRPSLGDERATLVEYLRYQRLTLELKCSGLDAADPACRSVPPSTMPLLGLVRHLAEVERRWFRVRMAGKDAAPHYYSDVDPDGDFDGAVPDPDVVAPAWHTLRAECAFTDQGAHGGGVRPAQRPRRPAARADRRTGGPVTVPTGQIPLVREIIPLVREIKDLSRWVGSDRTGAASVPDSCRAPIELHRLC